MTLSTMLLTCFLIFIARIGDVGLGTLRMSMVIQGRRGPAWVVGFFESLIWTLAAAAVLSSIHESYWYTIAYASGFATGGYVGISIERWLAYGSQVVRIVTRTPLVEYGLRTAGVAVTRFDGHGRDGPVMMVMVVAKRSEMHALVDKICQLDQDCFYMVEDVREARLVPSFARSTQWQAATARK